jgi:hypothetical protein
MRRTLIGLCVSGLLASSACGQGSGQEQSFPLLVRAVDDTGKPLADVALAAGPTPLGVTDSTGQRRATLAGSEGQRVGLQAQCPSGYEGPREQPAVSLAHTGVAPLEVRVTCAAHERYAVVAVRTGQPGLAILLHGEPVARTSEEGTAHVLVREPPGQSFQLTLDTESRPDLRPESPTHAFTVAQDDGYSIWDQPFERAKRDSARKRAKGKGAAVPGSKARKRHAEAAH